jgi:hypothetical protein
VFDFAGHVQKIQSNVMAPARPAIDRFQAYRNSMRPPNIKMQAE